MKPLDRLSFEELEREHQTLKTDLFCFLLKIAFSDAADDHAYRVRTIERLQQLEAEFRSRLN